MTGWAAGCVALAVVVVLWPAPGRRARRRRVLALIGAGPVTRPARVAGWLAWLRLPRLRLPRPPGRVPLGLLVIVAVVVAAGWGGAVAGAATAAYGVAAARTVLRRAAERAGAARRTVLLEQLGAAAADLRAGLPAGAALAGVVAAGRGADPLSVRVRAATRLAERTGAPLAEVVDRIEADARATDRARSVARAQAAGFRATAWLLAGLPAGGIALGYVVGADPLAVLLRTPTGAACALGAVTLQLGGLAWTARITHATTGPGPAAARSGRRCRLPGDPVRWGAGLGAVMVAVVLGGWFGLLAGAAVGIALDRGLRRLPSPALRARHLAASAELPLAADLLAVALRGGAPVDRAAAAVAEALPGPLADPLARVARVLRLGGTPAEAWAQLPPVAGADRLARAAVRSAEHGSALAGALSRLADDLRADRAVVVEAAARRAGVLLALPLGLCFLPAFVLAGLAPVIIAILGDVL
jgi:Flp pilus assembly protein TadB